jgi:hypothetical protein
MISNRCTESSRQVSAFALDVHLSRGLGEMGQPPEYTLASGCHGTQRSSSRAEHRFCNGEIDVQDDSISALGIADSASNEDILVRFILKVWNVLAVASAKNGWGRSPSREPW